MAIQEPKKQTLERYGLSLDEWKQMLLKQNGVCFICKKEPSKGRLVIDHEHVKGWKDMPDDQRKLYVRGLLCWFCNHWYVARGINVDKAQNVVEYLINYKKKHDNTIK